MIIIYTLVPKVEIAKKIAKRLLLSKLCVCVNMIPKISSMYIWPVGGDNIQEDEEIALFIKTKDKYFQKVKEEIEKMNPYEIAAIFSIDVKNINQKYRSYLNKMI
jgi:periplasmic divalent cation tolerance protein